MCESGDKVDFLSELSCRNCQHIVNSILANLSSMSLIKASKVSLAWQEIVTQYAKFPHNLNNAFNTYLRLNQFSTEELFGDHLSNYQVESHKLYPGGDVKTILVDRNSMFIGLASGLTKEWDLSNYDNFKYPASKFFDPDNGKGVTHLAKNHIYLATGHGDVVILWSLDTASIVSQSITLDSQFDFIGQLALSRSNQLSMVTRFNGFFRVYRDVFENKFEEHKVEPLPKKASLSAQALVFSFQFQDACPWFWHFKLGIYRLMSDGVDKQELDMKREVGWIFQDDPFLFLEMAYIGNKELQLWDLSSLTPLYSVELNDFHLRYLGLKNWIYWCHIGQGKGQLTYGSMMDLLDLRFYNKQVIEDDTEEELYLTFLSGNALIFSKPGGIEMKVFGLKYVDKIESYTELL